MKQEILVKNEGKVVYPIILTDSFDKLNLLLDDLATHNKKVCIVSDSNVSEVYMDQIVSILKSQSKETYTFTFEAGEKNKNLDTVNSLYENLITWKFDRKDILIALGGGVVGDLTGYVAATYLRGISFIQIPTSLLAMVDSSIGGKTGVDFLGYKNMIGVFHQPSGVYINVNTLGSLAKDHFYNGMAEIIKHGFINDIAYVKWISDNKESILLQDIDVIMEMIYYSCIIKKEVVEKDPKEQGDRALLNFGHTVGHAIETAMNFELLHGECVAIGMVAASYISVEQGFLTPDDLNNITSLLRDFKLPINLSQPSSQLDSDFDAKFAQLLSKVSSESLLEGIGHDKKQESGKLKFILLKEIGQGFIETSLTNNAIKKAIDYILP